MQREAVHPGARCFGRSCLGGRGGPAPCPRPCSHFAFVIWGLGHGGHLHEQPPLHHRDSSLLPIPLALAEVLRIKHSSLAEDEPQISFREPPGSTSRAGECLSAQSLNLKQNLEPDPSNCAPEMLAVGCHRHRAPPTPCAPMSLFSSRTDTFLCYRASLSPLPTTKLRLRGGK